MINLILTHKKETIHQTLGMMEVIKDGLFMFALATLELPWKNNLPKISRIWNDDYIVVPFSSVKHPNVFKVCGVSLRTDILIHIVNFVKDLEGCIGVGLYHSDINKDGLYDVKYSGEAMEALRNICKNEEYILLTIK